MFAGSCLWNVAAYREGDDSNSGMAAVSLVAGLVAGLVVAAGAGLSLRRNSNSL